MIKVGSDSINAKTFFPDKNVRNYLHTEFNKFYASNDYNLAWLDFMEPQDQADELLEALDMAEQHGLKEEYYNLSEIENLLGSLYNIESKKERRKKWRKKLVKTKEFKEELREQDTLRFEDIARLDFLLTASYLTYGSHLLSGRIDPNEKEEWFAPRRQAKLAENLSEALKSKDIKSTLEELAPSHRQYGLLRDALNDLRAAANDSIQTPLVSKILKMKDSGEDVQHLRTRLAKWKAIDSDAANEASTYDEKTAEAVKTFQRMNGIKESGEVDKETLALINKPLDHWISIIETNMERLRWTQQDFGDEYILVNIPAYSLEVMKGSDAKLKMKVIVGTNYKKTPVFSDSLEYITINPTWTVPDEIAVEEMLPGIRKDDQYLAKRNFELYDSWDRDAEPIAQEDVDWDDVNENNWKYRIVEPAGPENSLGRIKFMMPNSEFIYLHDTPSRYLFARDDRNFSHGCIRIEKPIALAEYLLGWDQDKVNEHIKNKETKNVPLDRKVPVHIVYWSAWVDDSGLLNFREDVYHHDRTHQKELDVKDKVLASAAKP